jgi:hypothetical protein
VLVAVAALLLSAAACSCGGGSAASAGGTRGTPTPPASATPSASVPAASVTGPAPARPRALPAPAPRVAAVGTGHFLVVPGDARAPGHGSVRKVRVEVEGGVPVDPAGFAAFVMATLNDSRSWGHGGAMTFARTDGPASIIVRLASPQTSASQCRPLITGGRLSCSEGSFAILTSYRWFHGQSEFNGLTQYRQYVVNHEVGHVLGHGHLHCGGAGRLAPVMQQQTKGVAPCRPNAWPFP